MESKNIKSSSSREYVVGLGEALWDCLPTGKQLGGAPANFAYHVSQFGIPSYVASAVGKDELGEKALELFSEKKLNCIIPQIDYPTGTVQVTLTGNGIPQYEIKQGVAWDNISFTPEMEKLSKKTRAVSFGSLAQRNDVSRSTIMKFLGAMPERSDVLKIFDINLRQNFYTREIIETSLLICNILKINDEELSVIEKLISVPAMDLREVCFALIEKYGLKMLILTCGTNGSYVFTSDAMTFLKTPVVAVEDTVGAGDAFSAAFCAGILCGMEPFEAHKLAVKTSAYVCTCKGAMPELPDEIRKATHP